MTLSLRFKSVVRLLVIGLVLCVGGFSGNPAVEAWIGVNWGDAARQPLPPEIVVRLLQSNNISRVKLFDTKPAILEALAGTGIEVMIAAPNDLLFQLSGADGETAAVNWVAQNLTKYLVRAGGSVNIKYVAVGNEPFWGGNNKSYGHLAVPALTNIQHAIRDAGLEGRVFATIPFSADTLEDNPDPSTGVFRSDIAPLMAKIVSSYNRTGAPLVMNMYPFLNLVSTPNFPPGYAFFGKYNKTDSASNLTYNSMFDEMFDRTVAALGRAGFPQVEVIVGEVGWPTDGIRVANVSNAQNFNNQLLRHLARKRGTPLRPNSTIDVYLFSLLDENLKDLLGTAGPFERHWGIFYQDGTPKYPIDLSGHAKSNSWPESAAGVKYLTRRYCIQTTLFQPDPVLLGKRIDFSCSNSDCTALGEGGSCSSLNVSMKASYALNMYYQFNYQQDSYCNFTTFGDVVKQDPSTETCKFPLGLAYGGCHKSTQVTRKLIDKAIVNLDAREPPFQTTTSDHYLKQCRISII
ncbi:hypothetical protein R1sor_016834 [Riccia sorocarpa]|uniref:X8 domain-containing protein n=1 Tax=Riccia sorocarpa TaxID=122646 RepID=A0ABD3HG14_9MARC